MNPTPTRAPRGPRIIWARTAAVATGVGVAALLSVALAGCAPATSGDAASTEATSSSASGGGPAKELDACSLLTAAQASSMVGETLSAGVSSTIADGQDQCKYDSSSSVGLTVIVYQPTSGVSWSVLLDGSSADKPVSGVGDKAETDGVVELDVQAGDHLIAVQNTSDSGRVAVAKELVGVLK